MPAPKGNRNAAGRRKAENEQRIAVSFSLSDTLLERLRSRLAQYMHTDPTVEELRGFARGKAYEAIEAYLDGPPPGEEE